MLVTVEAAAHGLRGGGFRSFARKAARKAAKAGVLAAMLVGAHRAGRMTAPRPKPHPLAEGTFAGDMYKLGRQHASESAERRAAQGIHEARQSAAASRKAALRAGRAVLRKRQAQKAGVALHPVPWNV